MVGLDGGAEGEQRGGDQVMRGAVKGKRQRKRGGNSALIVSGDDSPGERYCSS